MVANVCIGGINCDLCHQFSLGNGVIPAINTMTKATIMPWNEPNSIPPNLSMIDKPVDFELSESNKLITQPTVNVINASETNEAASLVEGVANTFVKKIAKSFEKHHPTARATTHTINENNS